MAFEEDSYSHGPNETFETVLTFKDNSVIVKRIPIFISNNDTVNMKRGEQLFQYKGLVSTNDKKIKFVAYAYNCSDCPSVAEVTEKGKIKEALDQKVYEGLIEENELTLNGKSFKLQINTTANTR